MIRFFLATLLSFIIAFVTVAQTTKSQHELAKIREYISEKHYLSPIIDDAFSEKVFNQFLEVADPKHLQFTAADIQELSIFKKQLDDEWAGKSWSFLDKFLPLYLKRLTENQQLSKEILSKPFEFEKNEFLNEDSLLHTYAASATDFRQRWFQEYKFQALEWLTDKATETSTTLSSQNSPTTNIAQKSEAERGRSLILKEKDFREKLLKKLKSMDEKKKKEITDEISQAYLNAFLQLLDPHTNYFAPNESQAFLSLISLIKHPSLGIEFDENKNEEIEIDRLIPGGAAWKSGELNKGDVLLEAKWADSTPTDFSEMSLNEVYEIMELAPEKGIELTVRKANGQQKMVKLDKELQEDEEELVKGFMLIGKKKIGYISLSSFYSDMEQASSKKSCANDLTKAVMLLNKEKIDGLILDIRNNGGGSVKEALNIAGIFIDEGPFFVSKISKPTPQLLTIKDPNRGTVFDGPLLVLDNRMSASASELLASILQTYHRAIIVGDTTYGKGSFQEIELLDSPKKDSTMSMIKITEGLCYGLNGKSWQQKGIIPDIALPDLVSQFIEPESQSLAAIKAEEIQKKPIYEAFEALPLATLAEKSRKRIQTNNYLLKTQELQPVVKKLFSTKNKKISLKLDDWLKLVPRKISFTKSLEELDTYTTQAFMVKGFQYNNPANDEILTKRWETNLQKDAYIEEAYQILLDYLEIKK